MLRAAYQVPVCVSLAFVIAQYVRATLNEVLLQAAHNRQDTPRSRS